MVIWLALVKSEFNMSSAVCWGSRGRLLGLPQTDLSDWTLSALWDQGDVTGHHWRNTANGVYASKVLQGRFKAPELQGTAAGFARPLWTSECRSSCCAPLCSQPKETNPTVSHPRSTVLPLSISFTATSVHFCTRIFNAIFPEPPLIQSRLVCITASPKLGGVEWDLLCPENVFFRLWSWKKRREMGMIEHHSCALSCC